MAINFANNSSLANITSLPASISGGGLTLVSSQTASASASIEFTSGIDSTYDVYLIKIINAHPSVDDSRLTYQGSTDGGSSFGVTATTTAFRSFHYEDDSNSGLGYQTSADLAQSTSFQRIGILASGGDNDECCSGELYLYNPSSTTFVKHFMTRMAETGAEPRAVDGFSAGYFNTTNAINGIQFKFDNSSNIDDGVFKLYGIS